MIRFEINDEMYDKRYFQYEVIPNANGFLSKPMIGTIEIFCHKQSLESSIKIIVEDLIVQKVGNEIYNSHNISVYEIENTDGDALNWNNLGLDDNYNFEDYGY